MSAKGFRFDIVDVFCEERYSGNQLAVVELKAPLPTAEMQRIAAEFNFPETTFVSAPGNGNGKGSSNGKGGGSGSVKSNGHPGFDVRIFTPRQEVPFAGHPTLGTAHILRKRFAEPGATHVTLNLKVGKIRVDFEPERGLLWMKQKAPVFGKTHEPARVAGMLGIKPGGIDAGFPVQEVSTGLPFLLIPLRSLELVRAARVEDWAFRAYFKAGGEVPLFIFCRETYNRAHHLNCRMFAPQFGIAEDPATGSANGCLAGYILEHGYMDSKGVELQVEQGYEMGRKSLLHLRVGKTSGRADIRVGGRVQEVAEGRLK